MPTTLVFPDPETHSSPEGIVCVGGDLEVTTLLKAYTKGIFPWPIWAPEMGEHVLAWFCPKERAVLEFHQLHIPRSLAKAQRRALREGWRITVDQCFHNVIEACAAPRKTQYLTQSHEHTWITPKLKEAYIKLHKSGYAHSIEVWAPKAHEKNNYELVGGLYGTCIGGFFSGESMFYTRDNASKIAVLWLIEFLKKQGLEWIDIQVITEHFRAFGARTIPRREFLRRLRNILDLRRNCPFLGHT